MQVADEQLIRRKVCQVLEVALLPPGYLLTPQILANAMEEALYASFKEEDLGSGKLYLRRLKAMMDLLEPGGKKHQPVIREILAAGMSSIVSSGQMGSALLMQI